RGTEARSLSHARGTARRRRRPVRHSSNLEAAARCDGGAVWPAAIAAPAPGAAVRSADTGRADGARSCLRHLRRSGARACDPRLPQAGVLLFRRVPRQVPGENRMNVESLRADIVEIGRRMYARGYTASNDGNISVRIGPDRLLMTPKSVCKGFMTP